MKRLGVLLGIVAMSGCGFEMSIGTSDPAAGDGQSSRAPGDGASLDSSAPVDSAGGGGTASAGSPTIGFPFGGGIDLSFAQPVLDQVVDQFVLDILAPGSSSDGLFTYLELLCRDVGVPEHNCRQLFGP